MKKFAVMRSPVLMEDEGRHFFVRDFETKIEAETWIACQKNEYFKPQDYYILESQEEN